MRDSSETNKNGRFSSTLGEKWQPVKGSIRGHWQRLTEKQKTWIYISLAVLLIFFTPWRFNVLLLGVDKSHDTSVRSRSDTMILVDFEPLLPTTQMLSIPRDLYVDIPGHGQDRINTAHYFAEIDKAGTGPKAAAVTVAQDFKIMQPYTVRVQMQGFTDIVNAMGGVDIFLPEAMSGLTAGAHHLNAEQALRFVRDRKGSDDYFRQQRAQIFLKGAFLQMLSPANWGHLPAIIKAASTAIDTNVPVIYWPRIGFSLLCSSLTGFHMQTLDRYTMTTPWVTPGGGQVLKPNWDAIDPLIRRYFR